ncbi:hypothetical protein [Haloferax sp. YSMS24]|uniref:hypothetical protein n=1 Tax=Haloferax sp. YSMS24 TaxID=3388425 RepID=UPI00398C98B5
MRETPFDLAIVTGELAPDLSDGGKRLAATLADHGYTCDAVMWDDPAVPWEEYDGVLELIEPYLGFDRDENTVERFARAIVSYFEAVEDVPHGES